MARGKKVIKAFLIDCQQEKSRFLQYAWEANEWGRCDVRMDTQAKMYLVKHSVSQISMPMIKQCIETIFGGCN